MKGRVNTISVMRRRAHIGLRVPARLMVWWLVLLLAGLPFATQAHRHLPSKMPSLPAPSEQVMPCHQTASHGDGEAQVDETNSCPHCQNGVFALGCDCCDAHISVTPVSLQRSLSALFVCIDTREQPVVLPLADPFPDGLYRPPQTA